MAKRTGARLPEQAVPVTPPQAAELMRQAGVCDPRAADAFLRVLVRQGLITVRRQADGALVFGRGPAHEAAEGGREDEDRAMRHGRRGWS